MSPARLSSGSASFSANSCAVTVAHIDTVLKNLADCIKKIDLAKGSVVKLQNSEIQFLSELEAARDSVETVLKSGDRGLFLEIFGGDCRRAASLRTAINSVLLSGERASDRRFATCERACSSLEELLSKAFGLQEELALATRTSNRELARSRGLFIEDEVEIVEDPILSPSAESDSVQEEASPSAESDSAQEEAEEEEALDRDDARRMIQDSDEDEELDVNLCTAARMKSFEGANLVDDVVQNALHQEQPEAKIDYTPIPMTPRTAARPPASPSSLHLNYNKWHKFDAAAALKELGDEDSEDDVQVSSGGYRNQKKSSLPRETDEKVSTMTSSSSTPTLPAPSSRLVAPTHLSSSSSVGRLPQTASKPSTSKEDLEALDAKALFAQLDRNGSGKLSRSQLKQGVKKSAALRKALGINKYADCARLFEKAGASKTGTIDLKYFIGAFRVLRMQAEFKQRELEKKQEESLRVAGMRSSLQEAYDSVDKDGDGRLNFEELKAVYAASVADNSHASRLAAHKMKSSCKDNQIGFQRQVSDEFRLLLARCASLGGGVRSGAELDGP